VGRHERLTGMNVDPLQGTISTGPNPQGVGRYLSTIWAVGLALAGPLSLVLHWTFCADSLLGMILLFFAGVIAAVAGLGVAIWSGIVGRWGRAIAADMRPLSLALCLLNSFIVWVFAMAVGEYIHFRLERESYLARIAALPSGKGPRTVVFVLSEDGWLGISNDRLVVYDESDEVALPEEQRSAASKVADTSLCYGVGYLRLLGDHFCIVRISY
jgi:hypothetical protein